MIKTLAFVFAITLTLLLVPVRSPSQTPGRSVTKEDVDRDMRELSNWGRWGANDELGSANLITAAKRRQGYQEAREGVSVSLSHDYLQDRSLDNTSPFVQRMGPTGEKNRGQFVVDGYS